MSTHDFKEERMPKLRLKAPASVVADYFHLFVNRRAYTLQSNRPRPESAQHYYYRLKDKKTSQGIRLSNPDQCPAPRLYGGTKELVNRRLRPGPSTSLFGSPALTPQME